VPWPIRSLAAAMAGLFLLGSALAGVAPASTPGSGVTAARPKVLILGDSVLEMICKYLPAELDELRQSFDVTCDGLDVPPFHYTSDGPALIRNHAADFGDHLVLALGYNDGFNATAFRQRAEAILAMPEVQAVPHLYWLTLRNVNGNYGAANQVLRDLAQQHPNLTLLDWHAVSVAEPRVMTRSDGIHLTAAGADAMADLITQALVATLTSHDPKAVCHPPHASVRRAPSAASGRGYYLLDNAGVVHAYGDAPHHGDVRSVGSPAVSMQTTPDGNGYWILTADGRVHTFGNAAHFGDVPSKHPALALAGPVRRLEPHPGGLGYWLMASDGGIFTFGSGVAFHGSVPGVLPAGQQAWGETISITSTAKGDGYYLIGDDGGVFTFGRARFLGSVYDQLPPGRTLDGPVIALAVHPTGTGYWLYALDGGIFSFGGVSFYGSVPGLGLCRPPVAVAMRPTATGGGYWVVTTTGWVIPFGDARDLGGDPALPAGVEVIDMTVRR
jgi:hypothetical protein